MVFSTLLGSSIRVSRENGDGNAQLCVWSVDLGGSDSCIFSWATSSAVCWLVVSLRVTNSTFFSSKALPAFKKWIQLSMNPLLDGLILVWLSFSFLSDPILEHPGKQEIKTRLSLNILLTIGNGLVECPRAKRLEIISIGKTVKKVRVAENVWRLKRQCQGHQFGEKLGEGVRG